VLAGRGSIELTSRSVDIPLDTPARTLPARRLSIRTPDCRVAMLYWYQLGGRAVASDHGYRLLLLYNRVVHGRSDGALVRVASLIPEAADAADIANAQAQFVRAFYADLLSTLPR
jgi:EpsI family protein